MHGDLGRRVEGLPWYHTLELNGVVTRGYYDLRGVPELLPIPPSLAGKRCLDIATANGFWAFEMARRGADEVVAIDVDPTRLDWPGRVPDSIGPQYGTRESFELARDVLGLPVRREDLSVYELTPERLGEFDLVFIGSVLLHLRDPVGALAAARGVLRGELISLDVVSRTLTLLSPRWPLASLSRRDEPRWWTPNRAGHVRMATAAGLEVVAAGTLRQQFGALLPRLPSRAKLGEVAFALTHRRFGVPSQWLLVRPGR